ncbi:MAG: non-heme iron oxygenase ferredoxin subunit [Chloroflexi bacterium]|nr:non-heme iron oxygenase ferredoxin subunit [Chloroflexota bacterium]
MTVSEWVRVADAAEIEPETALRVEIDGVPVALWNAGGVFYATQDTCTHEEASLSEGDLWGQVIECPLHGAQFDVATGEVKSLPAILPLATYPVKVEDGALYVGWKGGD